MKKDLAAKSLLDCPEVFADVGNVNLFDGALVLAPKELERLPQETFYKDNYGELREHRMDTRMKVKDKGLDIAILCLENQAGVCSTMPVRELGYIYSNYSEQIRCLRRKRERAGESAYVRELAEGEKLTPVIPLVLYYGKEKWDGPESILELLALPEEEKALWEPWILNHKIHLIHIPAQTEEVRTKYQSDFRHVADYLACGNDKEKIRAFTQDAGRRVQHPEELLDMLVAFCGDTALANIKESVVLPEEKKKGEGIPMVLLSDVLTEIGYEKGHSRGLEEGLKEGRERGIKQGIEQGIKQGIERGTENIISNMLQEHQTPEDISRMTRQPLEYVRHVQEALVMQEKRQYVTEKKGTSDE